MAEKNDWLIAGPKISKFIKEKGGVSGKMAIAEKKNISHGWKVKLLGDHNLQNIALAFEAVRKIGTKESVIKKRWKVLRVCLDDWNL